MADSEIRARGRSEDDLEGQIQSLRERLRGGELSEAALELCAYLGHAPAQIALGRPWPAGDHVPWDTWAQAATREVWLVILRVSCRIELARFERSLQFERGRSDSFDHEYEFLNRMMSPLKAHADAQREALEELEKIGLRETLTELARWAGEGGHRSLELEIPELSRGRAEADRLTCLLLARRLRDWRGPDDRIGAEAGDYLVEGAFLTVQDAEHLEMLGEGIVPALLGAPLLVSGEETDAEVDYLGWRARNGSLELEALRLSAWSGSEAAQRLTGESELTGLAWLEVLDSAVAKQRVRVHAKLIGAAARSIRNANRGSPVELADLGWNLETYLSWRGFQSDRSLRRAHSAREAVERLLDTIDAGTPEGHLATLSAAARALLEEEEPRFSDGLRALLRCVGEDSYELVEEQGKRALLIDLLSIRSSE